MNKLIFAIISILAFIATASAQSTVTANIHNACGWQPSTTYTYHDGPPNGHFMRVNNGPGWSPEVHKWFQFYESGGTGSCPGGDSGTYTPGATLRNYQLLNTVSPCTSAASGGPTTTASDITDGTGGTACHWKYVGPVDYVTFTGWAFDNGKVWTTGTNYGYLDVVHTLDANLPVFQQVTAGCQSIVKPTTSNINTTLSDGCYWIGSLAATPPSFSQIYLYYTSNANYMPMNSFQFDTFQGTISGTTLCITTRPSTYPLGANQFLNYRGMSNPQTGWNAGRSLWITASGGTCGSGTRWTVNTTVSTPYTGTFFVSPEQNGVSGTSYQFNVGLIWNDREYVSGLNGESAPIQTWNHNYHYNDYFDYAFLNIRQSVINAGYPWGYPTVIKPAPGEGFQDTYAANPSLPLAGYNANYGVGLRGVGVAGFSAADNAQVITGLQIKSNTGPAITLEGRAANNEDINRNILEGGTGTPQVTVLGAVGFWYDNLIIAHGSMGIGIDYGGFVYNNTIVCPGGGCSSAIDMTTDWINPNGAVIYGNLVFGFQHFTSANFYNNQGDWTTCTQGCPTVQGTNNATDVAGTDGVGWDTACVIRSTCTGYSFTNGSFLSYAIPFRTGYTYASSGQTGGIAQLCGHLDSGARPTIARTCGITNSLSPSSVFVSWPGNYRISVTSPAYGRGASYPAFRSFLDIGPPYRHVSLCTGTWTGCADNPNTPDLLATTRPQNSRYDIGAMQFVGGGPGPTTPGGKLFR